MKSVKKILKLHKFNNANLLISLSFLRHGMRGGDSNAVFQDVDMLLLSFSYVKPHITLPTSPLGSPPRN